MGPRRSHTKSRSGCQQCKTRRIKCDEKPPRCSNCERRHIECDLATRNIAALQAVKATSKRTPVPLPAASPQSVTAPSPSLVSAPSSAPSSAPGSSALSIIDLELLHHYTTVTYKTLPSGATGEHQELWQIQVVQVGFEHAFLLRGILAVSALHLAYLAPHRRESLVLYAASYQSIAVQSFHEALNCVNPQNCIAIFAFSCIIVALTFATPRTQQSDILHKGILDCFHMVRGCNSVVQTQWETLSTSFLAPLLKKGMIHETAAAKDVQDADKVAELFQLCAKSRDRDRDQEETQEPRSEHLPGESNRGSSQAYAWAIHELINTYTQVSILTQRKEDFVPVIFVWPIAIPQAYLTLLGEQRPEALVLLAYYAVLLKRMDDQWYMRGWARHLVNTIESAVGDEWAHWLKWPKEITRSSAAMLLENIAS